MSVYEHTPPRSLRKIVMGALLAALIAGGVLVFAFSAPGSSKDLVSQDITVEPFPMSPPDQPIPTPSIPPLPAPDTFPRLDPPQPIDPQPIR